jgi:hypothetical protein
VSTAREVAIGVFGVCDNRVTNAGRSLPMNAAAYPQEQFLHDKGKIATDRASTRSNGFVSLRFIPAANCLGRAGPPGFFALPCPQTCLKSQHSAIDSSKERATDVSIRLRCFAILSVLNNYQPRGRMLLGQGIARTADGFLAMCIRRLGCCPAIGGACEKPSQAVDGRGTTRLATTDYACRGTRLRDITVN